jgi:IS30 family transposase
MKMGRPAITEEQRQLIWELWSKGKRERVIARRLDLGVESVARQIRKHGGMRPKPRRRDPRHLSAIEREEISRGIAARQSNRQIARRLGRHHTTIGREISRCGGRRRYRAASAEREAWDRTRRPKPGKLECNPLLAAEVELLLSKRLSPEQIAGVLRRRHPDNEAMQVSHETIYRSLYVLSRGALRKQLTTQLRRQRAKRKPKAQAQSPDPRGRIKDMVMISERPPEAADRAVPGHWEGDLLIGTGQSAIATLLERTTRFTLLVALPEGKQAEPLSRALAERIATLPEQLRRSLTWDQGREMAAHASFSVASGLPVYFCDPRSPWQRASNENTNGLLRQYFPRGTDFRRISQLELDEVAAELNDRPRKMFGFHSPAEKLTEVLATGASDR